MGDLRAVASGDQGTGWPGVPWGVEMRGTECSTQVLSVRCELRESGGERRYGLLAATLRGRETDPIGDRPRGPVKTGGQGVELSIWRQGYGGREVGRIGRGLREKAVWAEKSGQR